MINGIYLSAKKLLRELPGEALGQVIDVELDVHDERMTVLWRCLRLLSPKLNTLLITSQVRKVTEGSTIQDEVWSQRFSILQRSISCWIL